MIYISDHLKSNVQTYIAFLKTKEGINKAAMSMCVVKNSFYFRIRIYVYNLRWKKRINSNKVILYFIWTNQILLN